MPILLFGLSHPPNITQPYCLCNLLLSISSYFTSNFCNTFCKFVFNGKMFVCSIIAFNISCASFMFIQGLCLHTQTDTPLFVTQQYFIYSTSCMFIPIFLSLVAFLLLLSLAIFHLYNLLLHLLLSVDNAAYNNYFLFYIHYQCLLIYGLVPILNKIAK